MNLITLYELLRGPLLWLAFGVFFGGMILRVILFYRLSKRKDGAIYRFFSWKWLWLSVFHWIFPLNETAKKNPIVTLVGFVFHICLIVTPIFLLAHGVLWYESWEISWWSLSEQVADYMTLIVIGCGLFFAIRRMVLPHVRIVTTAADYLLLAVTLVWLHSLLVIWPTTSILITIPCLFCTCFLANSCWWSFHSPN
jgi:hypothetical protein